MQLLVRGDRTVIAAPVQCDVDGIPKGSHYVRVPIAMGGPNDTACSAAARGAGRCKRELGGRPLLTCPPTASLRFPDLLDRARLTRIRLQLVQPALVRLAQ